MILTLDQGTTSSRAVLFDRQGRAVRMAQREFAQHYPEPGWVEHDPQELLDSQFGAMHEVLAGVSATEIAAIAITNQRETALVWDAETGRPLCNAVVWQCRRTATICEELKALGHEAYIQKVTGLLIDAYFSATKIKWILEHVEGARARAEDGLLRFGTVDTWLLWNLTGGQVHATDPTNACRTMLYDIRKLCWDPKLLELFGIPESMLPEVRDTSGCFGYAEISGCRIPITAIVGDQQAALFGQTCFSPGEAKNTYGTGCFILLNTGETCVDSQNRLLGTVAWKSAEKTVYALEGSAFNCGSAIQWLRDGLKIIRHSSECDTRAASDSGGVYFVPAFTGLGAPYWDMYARGTVLGITRGTTDAHIIRAVLECIAFQCADITEAMQKDSGLGLAELRVDGGASASNILLQFQADLLGVAVNRPLNQESTALGAAFHAGLAIGFWRDLNELRTLREADRIFVPSADPQVILTKRRMWQRATERSKGWAQE